MNIADSDKSYLIANLPVHERPRERLLRFGSEHLRDIELLAIILRGGPRGRSTLDLATGLLQRFNNSLVDVAKATPAQLQQVAGIGHAKAAELKATFALAERLMRDRHGEKPKINSPNLAAEYFQERFRGKQQEKLWVLLLDTKNGLIRDELITVGLLDRKPHPRA